VLGEYHTQKQALSRFFLSAMILSGPVLEIVRREVRRVSPDVRITLDQVRDVIANEVLKREVMEGDKADEARKQLARAVHCESRTVLRIRTGRPLRSRSRHQPRMPGETTVRDERERCEQTGLDEQRPYF
jgi:hypothetical protein